MILCPRLGKGIYYFHQHSTGQTLSYGYTIAIETSICESIKETKSVLLNENNLNHSYLRKMFAFKIYVSKNNLKFNI